MMLVSKSDLIIFCTPMSEYKNIIQKLIANLNQNILLLILVHQKLKQNVIKKFLKKKCFWTSSHPIAGSEVSGPRKWVGKIYLKISGVF